MTPRFYFGNYPNSTSYDPNIPIGFNKWDAEDIEWEEVEDIETENLNDGQDRED